MSKSLVAELRRTIDQRDVQDRRPAPAEEYVIDRDFFGPLPGSGRGGRLRGRSLIAARGTPDAILIIVARCTAN